MRETATRRGSGSPPCGPLGRPRRGRAPACAAVLACLAVLAGLPVPGAAADGVAVTDLRTWSGPERTRLVMDLDGVADYRVRRDTETHHLYIEIRGARNRTGHTAWHGVDERVREVRMEPTERGARVDVALTKAAPFKHFRLDAYGNQKPDRIVVDVYTAPRGYRPPGSHARSTPAPEVSRAPARAPAPAAAGGHAARPFVVVIDAGHGGEDPGAVGRYYRTPEKDVVLEIARRLEREIDAIPGLEGKLTRRGDYFISLGGRIRKADALHGDLFVSIHADMSRDRRTRGTHVYTLAPRSARDRRAVRVARMENASDFVGGVESAARFPMIFDGDGSPNATVESRVLARLTLGRLRDVNQAGREGRRSEARFWVLKGARPSLLVETGFLSNREDERHLRTAAFQDKLARDLAQAVRDYYEIRVRGGSVVHTVRAGETLSHIAVRYGVGVPELARVNRLESRGLIRPGDRLLVPRQGWPGYRAAAHAAEPVPAARPAAFTVRHEAPAAAPARKPASVPAPAVRGHHRVRRGESLTVLAQRYGVRIEDLARANGLARNARLWIGQRLAIPAPRPDDLPYTVASGDSLSGVAARYRVRLSELARVNDLRTRARLRVGQRLILPGVGPRVAAAPAPAAPGTHAVRRGETLSGLAQRYGVRQGALARANGLGLWAELRVGQRLTIPAGGAARPPREHRVARGETLSGLAQRYRVSLSALARANHLSTGAWLRAGQRLVIPGSAPAAPRVHVIRRGESLSGIARRYHVPMGVLVSTNALHDADRLMVGSRLIIPN